MRMQRRRFPLVRAALASALAGYWVANAIADPREYEAVGLRYEGAALVPILAQTAVVSLVLCLTGIASWWWNRRNGESRSFNLRPAAICGCLVVFQIGAFTVMETVERVWLGESYAAAFKGGVFDLGFLIELLIAIASALLLVALMRAMARVVRAILAASHVGEAADRETPWPRPPAFVRPVPILAGAGGVRSPPLSGLLV